MHSFEELARRCAPAADDWSARLVTQRSEQLQVRRDVPQSPQREHDGGAMVSVVADGALGYCATGDLSEAGLRTAFARALDLARASAAHTVFDYRQVEMPRSRGSYRSPNDKPVSALTLAEKFDMLREVCAGDARTTRHGSYAISQVVRKRIEEHFGWGKVIGPIRQTLYRGIRKVDQQFKLTMTASNLVRMARILREQLHTAPA